LENRRQVVEKKRKSGKNRTRTGPKPSSPSIAGLMESLQEEQEEWDRKLAKNWLEEKRKLNKDSQPSQDQRLKDLNPSDPYYSVMLELLRDHATVEEMKAILKDLG